MNTLKKRCIELSYKHGLTHISSVLNTVDLLDSIYRMRLEDDPVVLGNSHAALALYVVLESRGLCDAEAMIKKHGTHAGRDVGHGIWVSGGSLGQAETIAVGMALADRLRVVWLVTSDGACAEGSVWEAFHMVSDQHATNLRIYVVANGLGGYGSIDIPVLERRLLDALFPCWATLIQPELQYPFLRGLAGHYVTLTEQQYQEMMA